MRHSYTNNYTNYNIYNSIFFTKFTRLVLKKGQRVKAESLLLFLFTKLKKKKYIIFLYFHLLPNMASITPFLKKDSNKNKITKKNLLTFDKRYLVGLKQLTKISRKRPLLQFINESLWQLLIYKSTFYRNKTQLDSAYVLSHALQPGSSTVRRKKFKKKSNFPKIKTNYISKFRKM